VNILDVKQEILEKIIKECRQSIKEVSKEDIKELQKQLKILENIVSKREEQYNEKSYEYWSKAKLGVSYFFKKAGNKNVGESHVQALEAITKILDILRGEPLTITIQKVQRDSKGNIVDIITYKGKESNLKTRYNARYKQVEYDLEGSLKNLDKIEQANKAYIEHYSNFYNLANKHIKSTRSHSSSKGWRKKVNEGNIVEAYQRHMTMKHINFNSEVDTYAEDFTAQDILILLYYSVGNVPWWQQGDIGYNQIKLANNMRLASASSIRRVAAKILSLFANQESFNIKDFNEMFTAQDQNELVDISKLTDQEINNLMKEIKATGRFK
jgi:hypothetical protein